MKKFVIIILMFPAMSYALETRKDYFLKPQIGGWFGPITPVFDTAKNVETDLGGGLFFRYNTPFQLLKIGIDSSYQHYVSRGVNELYLVPLYGSFIFLLPFNIPIRFQLKAGAGGCWVRIMPDELSQWDLMFMLGFELSFPAGRIFNIGLRIDYLNINETMVIKNAKKNGHVINTGIALYFNI